MRYLKCYIQSWKRELKVLIQYPLDTIIWVMSMLLREGTELIGIICVAFSVQHISNWNIYELCILFLMGAIVEALTQILGDGVWCLGYKYIQMGNLDILKVRPFPILFQILCNTIYPQAMVSLGVFLGGFIYCLNKLHLEFSIVNIVFIINSFICGFIINIFIYLIFNSLNFWIIQGREIAIGIQAIREFAKYPLSIFPQWIQIGLLYVIPFGITTYMPVSYLLGKYDGNVIIKSYTVMMGVTIVGLNVWRRGLNRYESTGS